MYAEPAETGVVHVRSLMRELALQKAQVEALATDVRRMRAALLMIRTVTGDDDSWPNMADEVARIVREACK